MFLGGLLLISGGIGEWILGNTFLDVVFFTFGGKLADQSCSSSRMQSF